MAIAAALKYSLFLNLIRALLVLLIVVALCVGKLRARPRLRVGRDCAPGTMPLRNNACG